MIDIPPILASDCIDTLAMLGTWAQVIVAGVAVGFAIAAFKKQTDALSGQQTELDLLKANQEILTEQNDRSLKQHEIQIEQHELLAQERQVQRRRTSPLFKVFGDAVATAEIEVEGFILRLTGDDILPNGGPVITHGLGTNLVEREIWILLDNLRKDVSLIAAEVESKMGDWQDIRFGRVEKLNGNSTSGNLYAFGYIFTEKLRGFPLTFDFAFETQDGVIDTHEFMITAGSSHLTRSDPPEFWLHRFIES